MSVAAVVRTDELGRGLYTLVDHLRAAKIDRIILLDDARPDSVLRRALECLGEEEDILHIEVDAEASIAAWRNAGIAACEEEFILCVDPGWHPEASWLAQAMEALASSSTVLATSWFRRLAFGGRSEVIVPGGQDVTALLGNPDLFHPCSVFRRDLWEKLGGFDEELALLDLTDFWIRALKHGTAAVLDAPLVTQQPDLTRHHRRDLHRTRRVPAVTALYAKHRELFDADPSTVLGDRERVLFDLSGGYHARKKRRADSVAELDTLNAEIRDLTKFLKEHGEDRVDWGDLRRTTPISPEWGGDRGKPADRRYIETYLGEHAEDVRGTVLEVQEADYTRAFGGERVTRSDVVDLDPTNPRTTFVADLRRMRSVPSATYDCFILTQTIHVIDDMRAVVAEAFRILKPGGVLLTTFPCMSRVCLEYGEDGDFWRLTEAGVRNLLESVFPPENVALQGFGNVLTATAFLYGLACEEITDEEFAAYDPYHPVLVGARAQRPVDTSGEVPAFSSGEVPAFSSGEVPAFSSFSSGEVPAFSSGVPGEVPAFSSGQVLAYHRVADVADDRYGLAQSPEAFRAQMRHLREHYHPMSLHDLVESASQGELPQNAVAVTFDDGYLDMLEIASPILAEFGIPATFFITTEGLEREMTYWWDALERFLSGSDRTDHDELYDRLQRSPPAQRDALLRELGVDLTPQDMQRPMLAKEVLRLAERDGHTLGAHGVHHLALPQQPYETQRREIMESKTTLEDLLGMPVTSFAYPYGALDDTTVSLVAAAGFEIAVTCEEASVTGTSVMASNGRLRIPRRTVSVDADFATFFLNC